MRTINTAFHILKFIPDWGCKVMLRGNDAAEVDAIPHSDDPHYHIIAHRCGYYKKANLLQYCQEHELAHVVVAEFLRFRPSTVMLKLMHIGPIPTEYEIISEEVLAQTLQRFVRANEEPIVGDCDWEGMRRLFLSYSGEPSKETA